MKTIEEILAFNIKSRRKDLGWTQTDLSEKSGVALQTINRIEKGKQIPRKPNLEAIAGALGCSKDELYLGTTKPETPTLESALKIIQDQEKRLEAQAREIEALRASAGKIPSDILAIADSINPFQWDLIRGVLGKPQMGQLKKKPDAG